MYDAIRDGLSWEGTAAYLSTKLVTDLSIGVTYVRCMDHKLKTSLHGGMVFATFGRQGQLSRGDLDGAPATKPGERSRCVSLTLTGLVYVAIIRLRQACRAPQELAFDFDILAVAHMANRRPPDYILLTHGGGFLSP